MTVRLRFAPSPTGHLHVGNVRTALFNWLFARRHEGTFIVRVEDTDAERSDRRFEAQLLEDLRWLGLNWDEGVDVGGDFGPYRQTDRFQTYRTHVDQLLDAGKAYYCFCSQDLLDEDRRRQVESFESIRYVGRCRDSSTKAASDRIRAGEKATVRFRIPPGNVFFDDLVFGRNKVSGDTLGDFIIRRSDGSPQYNFAVVVDDHLMRISHVVRGEGHLSNTHKQILLFEALGFERPQYAHLSTILGPDGTKLSKRHGATSIDEFRQAGYPPEAVVNYLALLGWTPEGEGREILSVDELVKEFDLSRVHRSPATFDLEKLNWVSRSHLKLWPPSKLASHSARYLQAQGWIPDVLDEMTLDWLAAVAEMSLKYLDHLDQIVEAAAPVFLFKPSDDLQEPGVQEVLQTEGAWDVIENLNLRLSAQRELTLEEYKDILSALKAETGQKGKGLFQPVRIAITGRTSGPELNRLVPILEAGKTLRLPVPVKGVQERVAAVLATRP